MGLMAYSNCLKAMLVRQLSTCLFIKCTQCYPTMAIGNTSFDYVIVGGGNAGLTIASRLSEQ